ncbi:alpha-ketoglutarate-dependent dioxygenase AlkB family protein [Christiangramia sabulilitoris]|uniref:Alpha-ketoglutarate-dependent dioxygenase AlkB n=1 Tax=Christiangramia sabulilitoris TaxID=2583991 RepID=A0A550I324_9FLAO|nr:alpha-ketoglutarate-dependent dioxygenase AlkB [Christiangramia sabulilitoris]TRO65383.1 alpha-ketoglutarate-dependent dioxygenase AlkB [Christiangramia sabulilitoris]
MEKQTFNLKDAKVEYYQYFLTKKNADRYLTQLLKYEKWRHDKIKLFGREIFQPRLTALFGESGKSYTYSGLEMKPVSFTSELEEIRTNCEKVCNSSFNVCLANLYRDGSDSMGWHSDNEKELGDEPVIASVSLGAERIFHIKHKTDKSETQKIRLHHGSLLIMKGKTQESWKHQLPKSKRVVSPRVNLTFRRIY